MRKREGAWCLARAGIGYCVCSYFKCNISMCSNAEEGNTVKITKNENKNLDLYWFNSTNVFGSLKSATNSRTEFSHVGNPDHFKCR